MPIFKNRTALEIAKGLKAFLNLEVGLTRGVVPDSMQYHEQSRKLRQFQEKVAEKNQRLQKASRQVDKQDQELAELRRKLVSAGGSDNTYAGIKPENVIWIFGVGRSGNTWLSAMMGDLKGYVSWPEPCIGELFGNYYYNQARQGQLGSGNFVMGRPQKPTWLKSIRTFTLDGINGRFQEKGLKYVVIKEQRGSMGAPLLMEALPESRMILLVRDPRDMVASNVDAFKKGGWFPSKKVKENENWETPADRDPEGFAKTWAERYLQYVGSAKRAYEAHTGHKTLVKYEELVAEPLRTMRRMCEDLGLKVEEEELVRVVEKHSWDNIPEDKRGEGKFYRKASPGGWQEDLTPEQVKVVEEITAPLLEEFYPQSVSRK